MKKKSYKITVEVATGLHIGIGSDRPEIGGVDNPFIKDPISKLPYIPGSSLKGKLRSLIEVESDEFQDDEIKRNFGGSEEEPTRFIFRDLKLTPEWENKYKTGQVQTEIKTEIKIDRKTGKAAPGALRSTERIPPQTVFVGDVLIRYKNDEELSAIKKMLDKALELLNNDYLGGSGSRGYGAVKTTLEEN